MPCVHVLIEPVEEVSSPKRWILVLDKGEDVIEGGRGELVFNGPGEVWHSESHCYPVLYHLALQTFTAENFRVKSQ